MPDLHQLAARWLEEAETFDRYGAEQLAAVLRLHAAEVQSAAEEWGAHELTLTEAAEESGYSARHLRNLLDSGDIPNAGRKGAPRIRRQDLPRKPGHQPDEPTEFDARRAALRMTG